MPMIEWPGPDGLEPVEYRAIRDTLGYETVMEPDLSFPDSLVPLAAETEREMQYQYGLLSFLEGSQIIYGAMTDICLSLGYRAVLDVGCAVGPQSRLFRNNGISYLGLDSSLSPTFRDPPEGGAVTEYLRGRFPDRWDVGAAERFDREYGPLCVLSSLCALWIVNAPVAEQMDALLSVSGIALCYVPDEVLKDPCFAGLRIREYGRTDGAVLILMERWS